MFTPHHQLTEQLFNMLNNNLVHVKETTYKGLIDRLVVEDGYVFEIEQDNSSDYHVRLIGNNGYEYANWSNGNESILIQQIDTELAFANF